MYCGPERTGGYERVPQVPTDMRQPDQIELNNTGVEVDGNRYKDVSGKASNGTANVDTPVDSCESGPDRVLVDRELENKDIEPSPRS